MSPLYINYEIEQSIKDISLFIYRTNTFVGNFFLSFLSAVVISYQMLSVSYWLSLCWKKNTQRCKLD